MTMNYSSALANYRKAFNQRLPNESAAKMNNRRIQKTIYRGRRGGRGGSGHQGCSGRGGSGGCVRGTVGRNDDWEVTGLNGCTIRVHPDYRLENDKWFNITEETRLQLKNMLRDYHSRKHQHTDAGIGTNSQYQYQRKF